MPATAFWTDALLPSPMSGKGAAIVTGGAGGIGRAVLARLAADGFAPVSWDLSDAVPDALALTVDVTDDAALARAAQETVDRRRADHRAGGERRHPRPRRARVGGRASPISDG